MSRPRLHLGPHLLPGVLAVALFTVFALVILQGEFTAEPGFPDGSITETIGFALLNVTPEEGPSAENFVPALVLIALVLDAALDGAVHLASREDEGAIVTALTARRDREARADGGRGSHADGGRTTHTDGGDDE